MPKHNSTGERILLISSHSFEGVDSFDWFEELPNISDYDVVILDTPSIFTSLHSRGRLQSLGENTWGISEPSETDSKIRSNLHLVNRKLVEILEFDRTVYALYMPNITIHHILEAIPASPGLRGKTPTEARTWTEGFINTNDWCPISIPVVVEKGKTIIVRNSQYESYFKDFPGWQYYFDTARMTFGQLEHAYGARYKVTHGLDILAVNKVNKPIAVKFTPHLHMWADARQSPWHQVFESGGDLVLLPVVDTRNTEPHIEVLLQKIKVITETPPPSWIGTVEIPGEALLKDAVVTATEALRAAESMAKEAEGRLEERRNQKRLLYETGLPLQELVRSTLEALGANTEPSAVTDEFIVEVNGKEALIEVKGNTKSITKDDVAQLVTDLMQHLKTTKQEIDGILIGNAWRLLPLQERGVKDKRIFSRDAITVATNHNIGLISTTELFRAFCKTLEEPQYKKEVMNRIITGKGVITL
jgi:hypothetical protein